MEPSEQVQLEGLLQKYHDSPNNVLDPPGFWGADEKKKKKEVFPRARAREMNYFLSPSTSSVLCCAVWAETKQHQAQTGKEHLHKVGK